MATDSDEEVRYFKVRYCTAIFVVITTIVYV